MCLLYHKWQILSVISPKIRSTLTESWSQTVLVLCLLTAVSSVSSNEN